VKLDKKEKKRLRREKKLKVEEARAGLV